MRKKRTVTNASKLEELKAEYAANNEKIIQYQTKIVELQERNKTLATDITSRENTEIVGLVRGINMTPDQLAQLLVQIGKREDGSDPEDEQETDLTEETEVPDETEVPRNDEETE
jgi:hypothetical protein